MANYKEILRLYCAGEYSQREISKILGVSRNTVKQCIEITEARKITLPIQESVSNEQLYSMLFPVE